MERLTPQSPREAADIVQACIADKRSLAIEGTGSKASLGDTVSAERVLSTRRLSGIEFYEPEELVMRVRPGTTMADVNAVLEDARQMFAFEPAYPAALDGTIGGLVSANCHGPRRIVGGAIRDAMMGLEIVTGRGDVIRSGGRVMKNVTGFDLVKLAPGSWGTLGCMTSLTLQTTPRPEAVRTLVLPVGDPAQAIAAMRRLRRGEPQPTGLAWVPSEIASVLGACNEAVVIARIEGFSASIDAKTARLSRAVDVPGFVIDAPGMWQALADARPLRDTPIVMCATVPPTKGAAALASMRGGQGWIDWGGGRIWAGASGLSAADIHGMRGRIAALGGSLRLVRAPEPLRRAVPAMHPQPPALAALQARIREAFDPAGILNPGVMILASEGAS